MLVHVVRTIMAIAEITILKTIVATKAALLGAVKIGIAAGPVGLPLVIAGGVGSILFMDKAAAKTVRMVTENTD